MRILILSLLLASSAAVSAQVAINADGSSPNSKAMLDITSTTKGLLIPRMTTTQRTAISSPPRGLLVMDTTLNSLFYFNGSSWGELSSVNSNLWIKSSNDIYNTNSGNVSIGTTSPDATGLLHIHTDVSITKGFLVTGTYNGSSTIPSLGAGSRLMFYPGKAAFRAGHVTGANWNDTEVGFYSTAFGVDSKASGSISFAAGWNTTASGNYSISLGRFSTASNQISTAFGYNTDASGQVSTAMGNNTEATANFATSMGYFTNATGSAATSTGNTTTASGNNSFSLGENSVASGDVSIAGGYLNTASGNSSFAFGNNSVASGSLSSTFGKDIRAKGFSSTVIGVYNDSILTTSETTVSSTTPLFIIGNGDNNTTRSNALVVRKDGLIGIGVNAPTGRLHIKHNSGAGYGQILLEETNTGYARLNFKNSATTNNWTIGASPQVSNASAQINFWYDGLGADVLSLKGDGNATLYGILTQNSDLRLKKGITQLQNVVPRLLLLNGYNYFWKKAGMDGSMQTGLIAQEVRAIFPELVKETESGGLSVNYTGLIPYMIEAAKEQQNEINDLKKEVDELRQLIEKLSKKVKD